MPSSSWIIFLLIYHGGEGSDLGGLQVDRFEDGSSGHAHL